MNKNNKLFYSSSISKGISGTCIIEAFLCSGRLPASNARLSSIALTLENHANNANEGCFVTFEKTIKGTPIKMAEKIRKVINIRQDCSLKEFKKFEELGTANDWTDEQMGIIYHTLIDNDSVRYSLTSNSYITLREELLNILYPRSESRLLVNRLDMIKQSSYCRITEYYQEVEKWIEIYSYVNKLTKNESERRMFEVFYKGLGKFTSIEILKQGLDQSKLTDVLNYLVKLEEGIIMRASLDNLNVSENNEISNKDNTTFNTPLKDKKWCKIHKMKSHNTKDCILNPNRTKVQNTNTSKDESKKPNNGSMSLVINQVKEVVSIEIEGLINNKVASFVIDSGSDQNYVSEHAMKDYNCISAETRPISLTFGDGATQITNKLIAENVIINKKAFNIEFYVVKNLPVNFILGNQFLVSNDCRIDYRQRCLEIGRNTTIVFKDGEKTEEELLVEKLTEKLCFNINSKNNLLKLFKKYMKENDTFSSIKMPPTKFNVKELPLELKKSRGYSVPFKYINAAKDELKRLLNENIIEESNSPYSSPAFFLRKKNNDLRLVVDYKEINKYIDDDCWVLPKIEDCLLQIGKNNVFSQIDLKNGFNQILLAEESKKYTSFVLLGNQWQYKRISFGIKPGPKVFQRYMSRILNEIPNCFVYIDDIVLYSENEEEHSALLQRVLETLLNNNVKINFDKSSFFKKELDVLGYLINSEGISPKVKNLDLKLFPANLKSKKDVQKLLGTLNWYRKFIPDLSNRIYDLTQLLRNGVNKFKLDEKMVKEIEKIETYIKGNVRLSFPDYNKKFILETDASNTGIGSVLRQEDKVIGYYSKKLSKAELNYSIVEKEYYSILLSLNHFKRILQGHFVEVLTDNNNCIYESKKETSRINKWKLLMNDFNYCIVHQSGENNVIADFLSRCLYMKQIKMKEDYDHLVQWAKVEKPNIKSKGINLGKIQISENKSNEFLRRVHVLSGHRGITTMYNNLKPYIYIRNLFYKITSVIKSCVICNRCKLKSYRNNNLNKITARERFERISTDVYGPFKTMGFHTNFPGEVGYILSITDIFTRYTKVFCYNKITAIQVKEALESWCGEFNKPKYLISDNGKCYDNKMMKEFLSKNGIEQILIPEYTPSCNGISERINATISFILTINKDKSLDFITNEIENTLNYNYNRSLGCSPYTMATGYDLYDVKQKRRNVNIKPYKKVFTHKYSVGDMVYKRAFNAGKLDPKFCVIPKAIKKVGKKGFWVYLDGDSSWTHIKNIKLS